METKLTIRYVSGREDKFEVELFGGTLAETRLKEFTKEPMLILQTAEEIIIIPATAIECITLPFPEYGSETIDLPGVRNAKRLT